MTDSLGVERDDELYWELASAFAEVQIMELNEALKDCGIDDAGQRQNICSRFAFGMGNFLDQYWMEVDGKKHYPMVCFSETFLDTDTTLDSIAPLQIRSEDFEFHAAADEASAFFGENDQKLSRCRIGCVGDE